MLNACEAYAVSSLQRVNYSAHTKRTTPRWPKVKRFYGMRSYASNIKWNIYISWSFLGHGKSAMSLGQACAIIDAVQNTRTHGHGTSSAHHLSQTTIPRAHSLSCCVHACFTLRTCARRHRSAALERASAVFWASKCDAGGGRISAPTDAIILIAYIDYF